MAGALNPVRRGDIHLADLPPPLGSRPVLLVTRTAAITVRTAVTVAPVTRTIRDIGFHDTMVRYDGPLPLLPIGADFHVVAFRP